MRMNARVAVYQLSHKFINRREDVPENARQVVYYALAVGHHVGVMDCFTSVIDIPLANFCGWLEGLPAGPGKSKLEGVVKWGEVEINHSHVGMLLSLIENSEDAPWVSKLAECMYGIVREPALYLIVRKIP